MNLVSLKELTEPFTVKFKKINAERIDLQIAAEKLSKLHSKERSLRHPDERLQINAEGMVSPTRNHQLQRLRHLPLKRVGRREAETKASTDERPAKSAASVSF
jgi:hypothetical protein